MIFIILTYHCVPGILPNTLHVIVWCVLPAGNGVRLTEHHISLSLARQSQLDAAIPRGVPVYAIAGPVPFNQSAQLLLANQQR